MNMRMMILSLGILMGGAAVSVQAGVVLWFDQQDSVVSAVGETVDVDLWASVGDPIQSWGLDVTLESAGVAEVAGVLVGDEWDTTSTLDGDGLAGLRFPAGVQGDVLLASVTFTGIGEGVTELGIGFDGEDEGFVLEAGGMETVISVTAGTVTVVPEPAGLCLVGLGFLFCRKR